MSFLLAIVGPGRDVEPAALTAAEQAGAAAAGRGFIVLTGGRGGVTEAASRGACGANGRVLGVSRKEAKAHVDGSIVNGLGEARNTVIAAACDAMIVIGGGDGALSEVAAALKLGRPVIALASPWSSIPGVRQASDAEDAMRLVALHAGGERRRVNGCG